MNTRSLLGVCSTLAFVFTVVVSGFADTVSRIVVVGNERVESSTIETYLPFKAGDEFDVSDVSGVIKTLFATGLFSQVDVRARDGVVSIKVQENPLVNKVVVENNKKVDDSLILPALTLQARSVFTAAKAQRDAQLVEELYRSRGRFLTKVTPQVIARAQNRVDVVYNVDEGEKTDIKSIRFVGNTRFDDGDLRAVIATKESAFWRILSSSDSYDPNRLEVDRELLRRHYLQHGYADFQISSAVAELARDKESFFITFTIDEGPKYDFGAINVAVNTEDEGLDATALRDDVTLQAGELYNALRVEENIENLVGALGAKGFAFLDVQPQFDRNEATRTVGVTYNINPGPRVFVNRIDIEGNDRTRDHVIRRELRLAEGDAFNTTKLQRSEDRVNRLGYFENVRIRRNETEEPDRVDLIVEVDEQSTGEFNIGAGFSTDSGVLATADITERNFLGKGQIASLRFGVSQDEQNYNFSFTEPYFLDRELAASFNVFNEETDFQDESSFDQRNTGVNFGLRFPLSEFSSSSLRFGFQEVEITDVGSEASSLVARDEGELSSIFIGNTLAYDTRDSNTTPTRGYRLSLNTEYSGFGGQVDYLRGLVSASWHKELKEDWVLSIGGRAGAISDLGTQLPIFEHFTAGSTNLRGFDQRGIGPRDSVTDDALGGQFLLGNNIELGFPLGNTLSELGVKGILFTDGGIVTDFDEPTDVVQDSDTYRITVGAGVNWRSPLGPLRLEFGFPIVEADEDETRVFSFSVGTRF